MFTLGVSDHVMIAHSIADPVFGAAQRLHGATYAVEVQIRTERLNSHQVVMDIGHLRQVLRDALDDIDYRNLDEHPGFASKLSTTERVAEHVANDVALRLEALPSYDRPSLGGTLHVRLRESPVAYASYERGL